ARRSARPAPGLLIGDGEGAGSLGRAGGAAGYSYRQRPRDNDRGDSEVRRQLLPSQGRRPEIEDERASHLLPEAGGDVSVQESDACLAARNRPPVRREASLDGSPLHQEDRRDATPGAGFRQNRQQLY